MSISLMPSCPKLYLKTFPESPEVDQIYQVLKQATEISNSKPRVNVEPATPGITVDRSANSNPGSSGSSGQSLNRRPGPPIQPSRAAGPNLAVINPAPCSTSSERNSQDASGTRPFGQPLCIGPQINDKNGLDLPPTPPSPSPSKGKAQPILKKGAKPKK